MTPEQIAFIARRRRQIRAWPWLAAVLLVLLAGAYAWLWKVAPHNLDPGVILDEYNMRRLADQELILLAARGSMAMIACGLAVLVLVIMVSMALWNEHRLIRMLEQAMAECGPEARGAASGGIDGEAPDYQGAGPGTAAGSAPEAEAGAVASPGTGAEGGPGAAALSSPEAPKAP